MNRLWAMTATRRWWCQLTICTALIIARAVIATVQVKNNWLLFGWSTCLKILFFSIISTYLFQSVPCLQVRVVPSPDSPHRSGFIACVALGRVFKVRIRSSWAVHADVACHIDVRTAVRFAHHCHHSNLEMEKKETIILVITLLIGMSSWILTSTTASAIFILY